MEFKIIQYKNREEYPNSYEDGKPEFYMDHIKRMEQKYNISFPKVKEVVIGDSEYPFTEIHFQDGLILFDEEVSPYLTQNVNETRIANWIG